jgi:hypothetical protein
MSPACAHGVCTDTVAGPTCQLCPFDANGFGFSGTFCESLVCPLSCSGAVRGTCVLAPAASFPSCSCVAGQWTGLECATPICSPSCQNGASCNPQIPPVCVCVGQWQGADCSTPLLINTCPTDCGVGSCSASTNCTCSCPPGYSGNACQLFACSLNCSSNGACEAQAGSAPPRCNCAPQWAGGPACDQRVCVPNDCLNGGQCRVVSASAVACDCSATWTGSQCQVARSIDTGLSTGAIVGIAVSGAVLGVLVAVAIVLLTNFLRSRAGASANARIKAREMLDVQTAYKAI